MITSADLSAFSTVARHLNISRAAKEMGRSQSAVSRQIIKLEFLIGERLFTRTKKNLILTDIGKNLLHDAHDVLAPLEQINTTYFLDGLHGRTTLPVGMTPSIGMDFVALFVSSIEKFHPALELKIHLDFSDPLIRDLTHDRIELAFTVIPEMLPRYLIKLFSYQERFHVVGRKIPEDFSDARWVLIEKGTHSRELIDQFMRRRMDHFRVHFEINGFHNIIPYLTNSDDLSVLPSSMLGQIGGLQNRPLDLFRDCGLLAASSSLASWLEPVVEDFKQEFLHRRRTGAEGDIIPAGGD
ncbi:MAG: LysR family transcriptional regulator [bacterium]